MDKHQLQHPETHQEAILNQATKKSDHLIHFFLIGYYIFGLLLAFFYDTWLVALGVGTMSLFAYYATRFAMPRSNLYQYVLGTVFGIFMAQFIYQMHGMFEMHFTAFIGSAILITYHNWKLQLPLVLVVVVHHAVFGYMQFVGFEKIYFTRLEYMDLQTFIFHVVLAAIIFFICGLWAYNFQKYSRRNITQSIEIGRLQQAEVQNEELMKSNMELDKFVYSVSHDLRAPLTSMMGVITMSEEDTQEPLMQNHLGMLKGSIKKLDGFISDILDYSRNSRMEVKKEKINFKEMLDDIMNNLKYMSYSKQQSPVKINIAVPQDKEVMSDKSRLSVIMNNLISNAFRYQNPKADEPFVNISVDMSDTETNIIVKDNGIGISKENQEKIFDMFYRVSKESVGSGLGLYIVKETVDKLNGRIEVESELGKGTTFSISIPN